MYGDYENDDDDFYNNNPIPGHTEVKRWLSSEGYDWRVVAIFKRTSDEGLFWGRDAGCSCNDPFQHRSVADLKPLAGSTFGKAVLESDLSGTNKIDALRLSRQLLGSA